MLGSSTEEARRGMYLNLTVQSAGGSFEVRMSRPPPGNKELSADRMQYRPRRSVRMTGKPILNVSGFGMWNGTQRGDV